MPIRRQSLSPTRHADFGMVERAPRPVVGFAMDYPAGLATDRHAHTRAQLLYAVSGVMRIDTAAATYLVPPTMALFLPANAPHAVRMDGPVAMRTLVLRDDAACRASPDTMVIAVSPLLRELIVAACAEPLHWDIDGRGHFLTELALDEIARASAVPLRLPMPQDDRLRRAIKAVLARPGASCSLEHLATRAGASSRTLARLFRSETGLSFRQWVRNARMTEAIAALSTGTSPVRAAAIAGYSSQAAFGAAFRGHFGLTPGQARHLGQAV